jgi:hypothetical protein
LRGAQRAQVVDAAPSAWPPLLTLWLLGGALAAFTDLPPDVTYYAAWSRYPALGYLDHPGAVAWALLPWGEAASVVVRWLPLLWMSAQTWVALQCARGLGVAGVRSRALWVALAAAPLSAAGAALWTPDLPLLLGWSLGLWSALRLLDARARWGEGWGWGVMLCVSAALMTASKVSGAAAVALLVAALLACAPRRVVWGVAAWGAAACLVSALTLAGTGLDSLAFQGARLGAPWRWWRPLAGLGEVLGGALLVAGPGLAWVAWRGVGWAQARWRRRAADGAHIAAAAADTCDDAARRRALLGACAGGWLALWLLAGCLARVEVNWLAPALLPGVLWAASTTAGAPKRMRWWAAAQVGVTAALVAQACLGVAPLGRADPTRHLRGWRAWGQSLPSSGATLILSDRYQWASAAGWYAPPGWRGAREVATFDALGAGLARRPSALDAHVALAQHTRVLMLVSEHPTPSAALTAAIQARWPWRCTSQTITSPANTGPPPRVLAEVWSSVPCEDAHPQPSP